MGRNGARTRSSQRLRPFGSRGMTLTELLVALVLSVLVGTLLAPVLRQLLTPEAAAPGEALETWQRVLQADGRQLVSPAKCRVPVFSVLAPTPEMPFPQVVFQTLGRPGQSRRGPMAVTYRLEAAPEGDSWQLVRLGQGWHDEATSRHVLLRGIRRWDLTWQPAQAAPPGPVETGGAGTLVAGGAGVLEIQIQQVERTQQTRCWIVAGDAAGRPTPGAGEGP